MGHEKSQNNSPLKQNIFDFMFFVCPPPTKNNTNVSEFSFLDNCAVFTNFPEHLAFPDFSVTLDDFLCTVSGFLTAFPSFGHKSVLPGG